MIVGTPYSPPNPEKIKVTQMWKSKWLLGGSTKVTQKWQKSDPKKSLIWVTFRVKIRTRRIGANPEKSDLVNFWGPGLKKI